MDQDFDQAIRRETTAAATQINALVQQLQDGKEKSRNEAEEKLRKAKKVNKTLQDSIAKQTSRQGELREQVGTLDYVIDKGKSEQIRLTEELIKVAKLNDTLKNELDWLEENARAEECKEKTRRLIVRSLLGLEMLDTPGREYVVSFYNRSGAPGLRTNQTVDDDRHETKEISLLCHKERNQPAFRLNALLSSLRCTGSEAQCYCSPAVAKIEGSGRLQAAAQDLCALQREGKMSLSDVAFLCVALN